MPDRLTDNPLRLSRPTLEAIWAHARGTYPDECCGLVLRSQWTDVSARIRNLQDQFHAENPRLYPETARTAYCMDQKELMALLFEADENESQVVAFYHSHPGRHAAVFSREDAQRAIFRRGLPLYPEVAYLVLALDSQGVTDTRAWRWDEKAKDFRETWPG